MMVMRIAITPSLKASRRDFVMLRWALNGNLNVARISVMEVPGGRGKHGSVPPWYEKTFGGERPVRSVISMCATARPEANAKRGVYGGECARVRCEGVNSTAGVPTPLDHRVRAAVGI